MLEGRSGHTVVLDQHPGASAGPRYEEDLGAKLKSQTAIGKEFAVEERDEKNPQEKIENARAESVPGSIPEDADLGTGREKGTGLPPGSAGKGEDTPQTPAT